MIGNAIRGLDVPRRVQIFKACIWPIMSYGLPLWYHLLGKHVSKQVHKLERAQRRALLWMSGGFSTTPTASLEFLTGIAPVRIYCDILIHRASARLASLNDNHPLSLLRHYHQQLDCHSRATSTSISSGSLASHRTPSFP